MSDLQQIKKRIYEEDRIEEVLEKLGCWAINIEQSGNLYVAGLPDGDNKRSVQIKNNEYLTSHIRSKGISGDIFHIVGYIIYDCQTTEECLRSLNRSKYWICNQLNYPEYIDEFYKVTSDKTNTNVGYEYIKWIQRIKKQRESNFYEIKNNPLPKNVLSQFVMLPHIQWLKEGIKTYTQRQFQVGFDIRTERIIFPIHDKEGNLISIKGRYVGDNERIADEMKYMYLFPCNKSIELFNYHRALPYVKSKNEVIVVEGAKTVMLLYQWGFKNVVSIEGDTLSPQQVKLLKDLGFGTRYIFAWDKDKEIEFIRGQLKPFISRNTFVIFDKGNLLKNKDSPCDKGKEVFEKLYKDNIYQYK